MAEVQTMLFVKGRMSFPVQGDLNHVVKQIERARVANTNFATFMLPDDRPVMIRHADVVAFHQAKD